MIQLHKSQKEIAKDNHRFRVVSCGRRFGKTLLSVLEIVAFAVSKPSRCAYIAPTYQQARDIAWNELVKICEPVILDKNESRLELIIKTQNGERSTISLRGWESIETLRGQSFDFLVIDEISSMRNFQEQWQEVIRPTLTDRKGSVLFISTPKGFNHFYDLFQMQTKDTDYKSFHYTTYDNPHIPEEEIDKARQELTEDRFAQEYLADFRKTEGLIYKEFDRSVHIFEDVKEILNPVYTWVSVDWGFTNPSAIYSIVEDYDRSFWIHSEYYERGKTTDELIDIMQSRKAAGYYPDPAEPDRLEQMRRKKLTVKEVNKDVVLGIDTVKMLFKQKKLKIHKDCLHLIQELETYAYKEKKPNNNEPEEPIKENDHALDSIRYCLHMRANTQKGKSVTISRPNYSKSTYGSQQKRGNINFGPERR